MDRLTEKKKGGLRCICARRRRGSRSNKVNREVGAGLIGRGVLSSRFWNKRGCSDLLSEKKVEYWDSHCC
jgi:hypothetical protein